MPQVVDLTGESDPELDTVEYPTVKIEEPLELTAGMEERAWIQERRALRRTSEGRNSKDKRVGNTGVKVERELSAGPALTQGVNGQTQRNDGQDEGKEEFDFDPSTILERPTPAQNQEPSSVEGNASRKRRTRDVTPTGDPTPRSTRRQQRPVSYAEPTGADEDSDESWEPQARLHHTPQHRGRASVGRRRTSTAYDRIRRTTNDLYDSPSSEVLLEAEEQNGPAIKPEPQDDDQQDDLYSLPARRTGSEDLEMQYPPRAPFQAPTADNDAIMASNDPGRKLYAHELVKLWDPFDISPPIIAPVRFSREFLSAVIGGGSQTQRCTVSAAKQKAQIQKFGKVICTQYSAEMSNWNPHMPKRPGEHGLVYETVPLEGDKPDSGNFKYTRLFPIFCRRAPSQWEYCGEYEMTNRDLLPGEWATVPTSTRDLWAECYCGKGKYYIQDGPNQLIKRGLMTYNERGQPNVTKEQVDGYIVEGILKLCSVTYRCKGFDRELYNSLAGEMERQVAEKLRIKREAADDDEETDLSD